MAEDKNRAVGLARPSPAMSGAAPWTACAIVFRADALIEGALPSEPESSPARSDRMSPNRFSVTMTSKSPPRRTSRAAIASTCSSSTSTLGYMVPISRHTSRNKPVVFDSTFALCTMVTRLRRREARSKAVCAMRSHAARVMTPTARATSGVGMNSPLPTAMLRSA